MELTDLKILKGKIKCTKKLWDVKTQYLLVDFLYHSPLW